jgi:gamma-glutamylcyclotransferase (GGCT)/AIG2-like uncharacterized protein YtfP
MEYLFVYGIFRDSARNLLGDFKYCGRAFVKGKLFKVNEFYPGFIDESDKKVWGDIYLINPEKLNELDEFEGHEYNRIKVKTSTDIECWIYKYIYNISQFKEIKSGDWLLR